MQRAPAFQCTSAQTTEPSAGRKPAARAKRQYMIISHILNRQMIGLIVLQRRGNRAPSDPAPPAGVGTHEKRPQLPC